MQKLNKPEHPAIPLFRPEIPPVPTISEEDLRRELSAMVRGNLQPVLIFAALAYGLVALRTWFRVETPWGHPLFMSALLTAGFASMAWSLIRFDVLGFRWSQAIGAGLAVGFLTNSYLQFAADPSPQISTQLMLCLIVLGYLLLSPLLYLLLTLATIALWSYLAWISQFSGDWPQFGMALVMAALLAAWMHWKQGKTQRELATLRLEAVPQRAHLTKIAEQAHQHEQRFRSIWDSGFDGLVLHDHGTILDANESVCNLFGYERAELNGTPVSRYLAPESQALFADVAKFGNFQSAEAIGIRKDGTRVNLQLFSKAVPWDGSKITMMAVRDLTDHKQRESALLHEQERMEMVLRRQADLNRIELMLDQSDDLENFCRQVVESASSSLRVTIGSCLLLSDSNSKTFGVCASTIHSVSPYGQTLKDIDPRSALGYVIDHKEPLIVPDTEVASFSLKEHIRVSDIRAFAAFPVILRGSVTGILLVLEAEARHYNAEELAHLEILSSRVAVFLKRREIEQELHHANRRIEEQDENSPTM